MGNESESDIDRAFRAACRVSSELPDLDKYKSYDKAFVHHATDLIAQADIILAHCKDESIQVEVRADRDFVELSRREWPETGVFTQVFTYVQEALAGYVLLLEGIGSIKQRFLVHLLGIAMKSMEDFQQVEQDARTLLSHAEGVLATGLTSIGTPDGVVIDQLRRSLIERTRDLHTLNKKFREFFTQLGPIHS